MTHGYCRLMRVNVGTLFLLLAMPALPHTNDAPAARHSIEFSNQPLAQIRGQTNQGLSMGQRVEKARWDCVQNRRIICGKILKAPPGGLIIDSGYTNLMRPPSNRSLLVPGAPNARRPATSSKIRPASATGRWGHLASFLQLATNPGRIASHVEYRVNVCRLALNVLERVLKMAARQS
jgi:hypothetical protein